MVKQVGLELKDGQEQPEDIVLDCVSALYVDFALGNEAYAYGLVDEIQALPEQLTSENAKGLHYTQPLSQKIDFTHLFGGFSKLKRFAKARM